MNFIENIHNLLNWETPPKPDKKTFIESLSSFQIFSIISYQNYGVTICIN